MHACRLRNPALAARPMMSDRRANIYFDAAADSLARAIADRLPNGFALVPDAVPHVGWHLFVDRDGLMLKQDGGEHFRLSDAPPEHHRRSRRSALARACDAGPGLRVLDATAGWGADALVLARLGCRVRMLEADARVFAMLDDRLRRSGVDAATEWADARRWLRAADGQRYDVVYLDPMFPPRNKTALPSRPLQVLREIVGEVQPDASELLVLARRRALSRVVVKRRAHGPAVGEPDWCVTGRTVRFDVYRPSA